MKIHELLKDFTGINTSIVINDKFNCSEHTFYSKEMAIREYGFYTVRNWDINANTIIIDIQSQF